MADAFPKLKDAQAEASRPDANAWLSASAGTGKTQVLTARVLRLLLGGAKPESILCLTFTKAGAAEMSERINAQLGRWVRMRDTEVAKDLNNLGERGDSRNISQARTLFAQVLDARGGGLRIQTIHSFCQTLLAGFPAEAGLTPGFRPIEGREEASLRQSVLADLVTNAARTGQLGTIDRLKALSARLGEDATRALLSRCASALEALERLPDGLGVEAYVRRALADGIDDIAGYLEANCSDMLLDCEGLARIRSFHGNWLTKAGAPRAGTDRVVATITAFLGADPKTRIERLEEIRLIWRTADGDWRKSLPEAPDYMPLVEKLDARLEELLQLKTAMSIAQPLSDALILGRDYARAYQDAKRAHGVVDFNDMIQRTVALLKTPGMGDWVRFKLDQSTDHVLIDEAQDTNAAQWDIVKALTEEYFAGAGQKPGGRRTLFAVGDYKQAIFGFQGTDPTEFEAARTYFESLSSAAEEPFLAHSLVQSFRSTKPILEVVDKTRDEIGHEAMGMGERDPDHQSAISGSGSVTLWPATGAGMPEGETDDDANDEAEEQWIDESALRFAHVLARRIKGWTSGGLTLLNQDGRVVRPEDILVLLRSRGEMARLIVSRLYEEGVPVAGVDRLRLNAPIAVMDLLACIRFVLQPQDDLSLAALLVSPLIGWTQDELYERTKGREGALWPHLRAALSEEQRSELNSLLAMADRVSPYQFLETILSGPIRGRAKLIARLGEEARDPIEELLNAALAFERESPPTFQLFIDWFDRGDVEIKRDPSKPESAVRVMTVHGAKGLQAPVVILADATRDPDNNNSRALNWTPEPGITLPVFRPPARQRVLSLKDSADRDDARERNEHWRLLYVALTRAEEHLFIGGALGRKQQAKGMGPDCWHIRVQAGLSALGCMPDADGVITHARFEEKKKRGKPPEQPLPLPPVPDWAKTNPPDERRPPRPLAPSKSEADDTEASPPPDPTMRATALRGSRLHSLFERLPAVTPGHRPAAADHWLENASGVTDPAERADLVSDALAVIEDPSFAALFGPDSLAEAPLAGIVGERVIAGTVDRLLITDDSVLVVDFKTGRRVPRALHACPESHVAQMAAYAAVLRSIFPDKAVKAALLYTSGPTLIPLDAATLDAYKPGYRAEQDKLAVGG